MSVLRRALWPSDDVAEDGHQGCPTPGPSSNERLSVARNRARRAIVDFFPSKFTTVFVVHCVSKKHDLIFDDKLN